MMCCCGVTSCYVVVLRLCGRPPENSKYAQNIWAPWDEIQTLHDGQRRGKNTCSQFHWGKHTVWDSNSNRCETAHSCCADNFLFRRATWWRNMMRYMKITFKECRIYCKTQEKIIFPSLGFPEARCLFGEPWVLTLYIYIYIYIDNIFIYTYTHWHISYIYIYCIYVIYTLSHIYIYIYISYLYIFILFTVYSYIYIYTYI